MNFKSRARIRFAAITLPCVGFLGTAAHGAMIDFETPGDLSSKFFGAVSGGTVAENYVEAAGIGIGTPASRAIDTIGTSTNYTTLIYKSESFSIFRTGDAVTVSAFAKRMNDANPSN